MVRHHQDFRHKENVQVLQIRMRVQEQKDTCMRSNSTSVPLRSAEECSPLLPILFNLIVVIRVFCIDQQRKLTHCQFAHLVKMSIREVEIGSGNIRGSFLVGNKQDFYYDVPEGTTALGFRTKDTSANTLNIGGGNGKATLHWNKGEKKARVHAWVNGAVGSPNEISWTDQLDSCCPV